MINNNTWKPLQHKTVPLYYVTHAHYHITYSKSKCRSARPKTYPKVRVIFLTRNKLWTFRMNMGQRFCCALTGLGHPVTESFLLLASLPLIPIKWTFQLNEHFLYLQISRFFFLLEVNLFYFLFIVLPVCIIYDFHMFLSVWMKKCWWSRCLEEF